jgi:hypothetical protein
MFLVCKIMLSAAALLVIFLCAGCGTNPGLDPVPVYPYPPISSSVAPKATDNLYFAKPVDGFKAYVGLPGFPLDRYDARWLGNAPGFEFYEGHHGGTGDTLEVLSVANGMYFHWAYNILMYTACFENWQGQVELEHKVLTGIRIGSTAADFMNKFPTAISGKGDYGNLGGQSYRVTTSIVHETWTDDYSLTADCNAAGIIKRLRVDVFNPTNFNYFGP